MESKQQNFLQETIRGNTSSNWVDKNGHVNISHYINLLDKSLEALCSFPGSINSILKKDDSYVARSYCVKHQLELIHPSSWCIRAGITSITTNKFISFHCLYRGQTRVAKFYLESVYFDLVSRKAIDISLEQLNLYTHGLVTGFDQMIIK
jgi:acyl-CoA thioesterase FadM